jgi:hypothetical protein
MNSKIKSEKGIGCQPYRTLCLAHCEVSYLLPLFDQMIDEVIGQSQSTSGPFQSERVLFGDVQAAGGKFLIIRGLLGNKYV